MATKLADFVRYMFDAQDGYRRRERFFANPEELFAEFAKSAEGAALTAEEKAVVFAMERTWVTDQIWQREQQDVAEQILGYDFDDNGGPDNKWDPGDIEEDPYNKGEGGGGESHLKAMAAGGGGWTVPNPTVWEVRPFAVDKSKRAETIVVVAEGILPGAELVLSTVYGQKPPSILRAPLTDFVVRNFRRIYAKAEIDLTNAETGDYEVHIRNHSSCPYVTSEVVRFTVK